MAGGCPPRSAAEHERWRQDSRKWRWILRSQYLDSSKTHQFYQPNCASQLSSGWSITISLFYYRENGGERIEPRRLASCIERGLLAELSHVAGRITSVGTREPHENMRIECNNAGIDFIIAEAPRIWSIKTFAEASSWACYLGNCTAQSAAQPFYVEPVDTTDRGSPLLKLRLTQFCDGDILSMSASHMLGDASHLLLVCRRLSELYQAVSGSKNVPRPLVSDVGNLGFQSMRNFCSEQQPPAVHTSWEPKPLDSSLSLRQWVTLPKAIWELVRGRQAVHVIHLPQTGLDHLKRAANYRLDSDGQNSSSSHQRSEVSTLDAVSALVSVVTNSLLHRSLVPLAPELLTINTELFHASLGPAVLSNTDRVCTNTVGILQVVGLEKGTNRHALWLKSVKDNGNRETPSLRKTALCWTAQMVREKLNESRRDATGMLQALHEQEQMASMNKLKLAANFIAKGARLKTCATTAVTRFPLEQIDFGSRKPVAMQLTVAPWFHRFALISPAPAGSDGLLLHLALPQGLPIEAHPAWQELAPGTKVFKPQL